MALKEGSVVEFGSGQSLAKMPNEFVYVVTSRRVRARHSQEGGSTTTGSMETADCSSAAAEGAGPSEKEAGAEVSRRLKLLASACAFVVSDGSGAVSPCRLDLTPAATPVHSLAGPNHRRRAPLPARLACWRAVRWQHTRGACGCVRAWPQARWRSRVPWRRRRACRRGVTGDG